MHDDIWLMEHVASSGTPLVPKRSTRNPCMELMLQYDECKQSIHVQYVSHGKSARISCTCALVSFGAFGPAVRTGNPVTGSRMIGFRTTPGGNQAAEAKLRGSRFVWAIYAVPRAN